MMLTLKSQVELSNKYLLPRLGLGVFLSEDAKQTCSIGLAAGYRHIDTAQYYKNERAVAQAVRESGIPREDIFITTKIFDISGGEATVSQRIKKSVDEMKLGYIDLLLIHSPMGGKADRLSAWRAFENAVTGGDVRSIGVSNFGVKHLKELLAVAKIKPTVNQIELHPWCMQRDITQFCHQEGIVVEAYTPLTRGKRLNDSTVVKVATKHRKSPAQVLIRWSLQHGFVPLPKSDHEERIRGNADIYDFELDEADMKELDSLDRGSAGAVTWNPVNAD